MSIQSILDRNGGGVITIRATETVKTAADRMRARGIAALVITGDDAIAGLISERDIVRAVSVHAEQALSMTVQDIAPHAMITVAPGDTLKHAMSLMTNHRVRHLPVFADRKLVGIVSIGMSSSIGWKNWKPNRMCFGTPTLQRARGAFRAG